LKQCNNLHRNLIYFTPFLN